MKSQDTVKSFSQPKKKTSKNNSHSITKACPELSELMQSELTHLSFDCPKLLRLAFKQRVRANGSSVCHVLQTFMLTYLTADYQRKACFSDTMRSPVNIENLVVPTYVKRRVRRIRKEEVVEEVEYNYYTSQGEWIYRDVEPSKLNEFGHVPGCGCKWCREIKSRG